jgi:acyl-CoA synthetase (AMP-forming)/AMP-acid ligase II
MVVNDRPGEPFYAAWERVTGQGLTRRPERAIRLDDPAYLNLTSGITGLPKGAVTTYLNLLYNTLAAVEALKLTFKDVPPCMFPVVPPSHELIMRLLFLGKEATLVESIHSVALARVTPDVR